MRFGAFELFLISDGSFKLDGGAMFGVVPKNLWNRLNPADEENRITLGLNCLLIRSEKEIILVDTGIGANYDEKFTRIFGIHRTENLHTGLRKLDIAAKDVTKVILTHLHFDHCGGNCTADANGKLEPTFPNATYLMQKGELDYARKPDPRSKGSYFPRNWEPIEQNGQLQQLSGDDEIVPGVKLMVTGGHTKYHQIVKVTDGEETACYLADLVPTDSHLKTPYVMGYDLYPKQTMEVKERVLHQAMHENWLLLFEHAPVVRGGYLHQLDGKLMLERTEIN